LENGVTDPIAGDGTSEERFFAIGSAGLPPVQRARNHQP